MNELTAQGNAGADAELRETHNGTAVASVRIALSNDYFDRQRNEWVQREPTWLKVTSFDGNRAYKRLAAIRKGDGVLVRGKVDVDAWTSNEGAARATLQVVNPRTLERLVPDEAGPYEAKHDAVAVEAAIQDEGESLPW